MKRPAEKLKLNPLWAAIRAVLLAGLALVMGACADKNHKPDLPGSVVVKPVPVQVKVREYVRVPDALTDPLPIAEGPLSQCPMVAAERRKTIEQANADRKATRALSGTEVKP